MANENKKRIVNAIWENPAPAFGCDFKHSGQYWENKRGGEYDEHGKIRLRLTASGENITVFYNGSSRNEQSDIFTYLGDYVYNTPIFKDILQQLAATYNITLEYSEQERRQMARAELAREVGACLIEALRANPQGETAQYITQKRGLRIDHHFGELTTDGIKRVKEYLKNRNFRYNVEDLAALGITEERARNGYNCVMPYYRNGVITGFVFRNIRPDIAPKDRYRYSDDLGRGGYCDRLTTGQPAVIVEGQPDAIRLIQAGITNVIAQGGAKISEDIARMLKGRDITEITYIPDTEYSGQGERKTDIIKGAIQALLSAKADGEQFIKTLYIADVPTPEGVNLNGYKIDIDDYGKISGDRELKDLITLEAVTWWSWEIERLVKWGVSTEEKTGQPVNIGLFQNKFNDIYTRCVNPYERQRIKTYIKGQKVFEMFGITPRALEDVDEWNRAREYHNRINDAATALNKAVEGQASPATIGRIIKDLHAAQGANTRDEWARQLNESFADELEAVKNQPDTLKTKWELGNITKTGEYVKYENIEFYPADITVFCAPTSHGKTMILFQSALDLINTTDKTYLYISCEENKRQLLERALNVYLDIDTTDNGTTAQAATYGRPSNGYCFKKQTRKKTIKAILRGDNAPKEYEQTGGDFMGNNPHYNALSAQVRAGVDTYGRIVRPRLKLIHTDANTESICSNIMYFVEEYRAAGVEVGAVFVDYMQLLTSENKSISRHGELKDICKALHDCAGVVELPIIVAAQFNREALREGVDHVTVANIGEGADIERIAHDIYLLWQVDKTPLNLYTAPQYATDSNNKPIKSEVIGHKVDAAKLGLRSYRMFEKGGAFGDQHELKRGYMYIEQLKARDGKTEGWGLFPFNGERGLIEAIDKDIMKK